MFIKMDSHTELCISANPRHFQVPQGVQMFENDKLITIVKKFASSDI